MLKGRIPSVRFGFRLHGRGGGGNSVFGDGLPGQPRRFPIRVGASGRSSRELPGRSWHAVSLLLLSSSSLACWMAARNVLHHRRRRRRLVAHRSSWLLIAASTVHSISHSIPASRTPLFPPETIGTSRPGRDLGTNSWMRAPAPRPLSNRLDRGLAIKDSPLDRSSPRAGSCS